MEGRRELGSGDPRGEGRTWGNPQTRNSSNAARAACRLGSLHNPGNHQELGGWRSQPGVGKGGLVEEESGCRETGTGCQDEKSIGCPLWLRLRAGVVHLPLGDR